MKNANTTRLQSPSANLSLNYCHRIAMENVLYKQFPVVFDRRATQLFNLSGKSFSTRQTSLCSVFFCCCCKHVVQTCLTEHRKIVNFYLIQHESHANFQKQLRNNTSAKLSLYPKTMLQPFFNIFNANSACSKMRSFKENIMHEQAKKGVLTNTKYRRYALR